jgi:hypothetical protein
MKDQHILLNLHFEGLPMLDQVNYLNYLHKSDDAFHNGLPLIFER